jgi:hypothetical protein
VDELSPVRFEHHREALGIGEAAPRLSWHVAAEPGWQQAAYELAIGGEVTPDLLPALADAGHADIAHELLFQDTPPSWLAMIARARPPSGNGGWGSTTTACRTSRSD